MTTTTNGPDVYKPREPVEVFYVRAIMETDPDGDESGVEWVNISSSCPRFGCMSEIWSVKGRGKRL
jgi:hypothetical protein